MRIDFIQHDGVGYAQATPEELRAAGVPDDVIASAVANVEAAQARAHIRAKIYEKAGDPETLLGTTNDVAAAALIGVAYLIALLAVKGSADVKAGLAASPLPADLAQKLIAGIADGAIKPPLLVKGVESVFEDMIARGNATAEVLASAQK